jgi:hypothetical protein
MLIRCLHNTISYGHKSRYQDMPLPEAVLLFILKDTPLLKNRTKGAKGH